MVWWQVALAVGGSIGAIALLAWHVRHIFNTIGPPPKLQGDSAPGWILECKRCGMWRPAGETGMIRKYAAGEKLQIARCSTCLKFRWVKLRRGPGPIGTRKIDDRTNPEIWPETIDQA